MVSEYPSIQITKSSQLERQLGGISLFIAPFLFAMSTFFWKNGEYGVEAATLIIFSMFFWIPALRVLFSLVREQMPRYSVLGLWIAVFGCVSGVCFAFLGYLATVFNISHQQYLASLSNYPITSQVLLFASGPLFPMSVLVLGITMMVKGVINTWIAALLCIGAISFPVSRILRIEWISHLADICLLIPCAIIGLQIVGKREIQRSR